LYLTHLDLLERAKLGSDARAYLFIQLTNFPNHYLVIVVTDEKYRFALITTSTDREVMFAHMILQDIAWLDYDRIRQETLTVTKVAENLNPDAKASIKRMRAGLAQGQPGFPE
jgi:mediator of RNA polymerase II transcription subunit 14